MNQFEYVVDEFGLVGVRLTPTKGAFLYGSNVIVADCFPTKKTAPLKKLPPIKDIESYTNLIPPYVEPEVEAESTEEEIDFDVTPVTTVNKKEIDWFG